MPCLRVERELNGYGSSVERGLVGLFCVGPFKEVLSRYEALGVAVSLCRSARGIMTVSSLAVASPRWFVYSRDRDAWSHENE